jgi:hypothetical protein
MSTQELEKQRQRVDRAIGETSTQSGAICIAEAILYLADVVLWMGEKR